MKIQSPKKKSEFTNLIWYFKNVISTWASSFNSYDIIANKQHPSNFILSFIK